MSPVLLSRTADPLLGIFTGVFAYYLHEKNPRSAIPEDERLVELVKWKYTKWKLEREQRLASEDETVLTVNSSSVEKA